MPLSNAHHERILILAVDRQLQKALLRAITDQGYTTRVVGDIAEAGAVVADFRPQLCVLAASDRADDTAELMDRIRLCIPDTRFLIIGDTRADSLPGHVESDRIHVLHRPFGMLELIRVIDAAVSGAD